jgi:TRAP-type C4-dicarboxylate transport system substrate-binding protein
MEKRNLIISVMTVLVLVAGVFAGSASAQKTVLTYANFPPASTFPCVQMEKWKTEVELRSAGEVEVKTFPGSTLLGAKNMMDGVESGVADIGVVVFAYQPGRFPLMGGVDLPIGFPNSKVANAVLYDLYKKYQPKSLSKVKVLALFTAPPADIMSKKPIRNLKDLKGYELRCTGAGVKPLKLLGAVPVAMPMSETPEALQKGIVKGIFSSLDILKDFNFAESCRYATICHMQTTSFAVVMNMKKWNSLPDKVKKIMEDLSREHSLWTGEYIDRHVKESTEWAKKKYKEEVITLSDSEYQLWHKKVEPIKDEWLKKTSAKGLPAEAFYKDLMAFKAKYEKEFGVK